MRPFSLMLLVVLLATCVPEPTGEVPSRPLGIDASADEVYEASVEAMANVTSYRWVADVEVDDDAEGDVAKVRVEGVWVAGQNYDFTAKYQLDDGATEVAYRVVEGRWFRRLNDVWGELSFQDPLGVPRFRGRSELLSLDEVEFSRNVTSTSLYLLVGESERETGSEQLGHLRLYAELAIGYFDLLPVSIVTTGAYENGAVFRQTTRFTEYNQPVTIDLPGNRIDLPVLDSPDAPEPTPTPTP